jgi:hypothetical protein
VRIAARSRRRADLNSADSISMTQTVLRRSGMPLSARVSARRVLGALVARLLGFFVGLLGFVEATVLPPGLLGVSLTWVWCADQGTHETAAAGSLSHARRECVCPKT